MNNRESCPCGSGLAFVDCCGRYIANSDRAPTAEALMRSRYAAYARSEKAYLLETWHESTRPQALDLDPSVKWIDLAITSASAGREKDSTGMVEFKARYKVGGRAYRMHEISRFVKESGKWFYVDGEMKNVT
jgi:SEC-C motif-containing protein